jgi:hypothetical protein
MGGIARELGRLAGTAGREGRTVHGRTDRYLEYLATSTVDIWYASHTRTILVPGTLININCEKCSLYENYGCNLVRVNPLSAVQISAGRQPTAGSPEGSSTSSAGEPAACCLAIH